MIKTTFSGASPWAGLVVSPASKLAKEQPLPARKKPPQIKIVSRSKSNAALRAAQKVAPKGQRNHMSVLTDEQAREIVECLKRYREIKEELKTVSPAGLARRFGVAENTVRHIQKGRSWVHLSGFPKPSKAKK